MNEVSKLENLWTEVNPREQNLKSKPAKAMRTTLLEDSRDIFHFLNRGIVITVSDFNIDQSTHTITLDLSDEDLHGALDGGHTLKTILETLEKNQSISDKHVMLEVLCGVDDFIFDLARSRNTSTQVKEKSMANLEGKFDFIQHALEKSEFIQDIAWTENEEGRINISEIIQILTAFNPALNTKEVIKTYSGAGACEKRYITEFDKCIDSSQLDNPYYKLTNVMNDLFILHDDLYMKIPQIHNENGFGIETESGKFGGLKGVKKKDKEVKFKKGEISKYDYPKPMYYPILASFRLLLEEKENGLYDWVMNPYEVFEQTGIKMVQRIMHYHNQYNGAVNKYGKEQAIWEDMDNYIQQVIDDYKKNLELEELKRKIAELEASKSV